MELDFQRTGPVGCGAFESPTDLRAGRADKQGWFRFEVPRSGDWNLLVRAPGRSTLDIPIVGVRSEVVLDPLAFVAGRVRFPDGTPAAGLKVEISTDSPYDERTTRTDGAGRYRFDGLSAGKYFVLVESTPGAASIAMLRRYDVKVPGGKIDFVATRAPSISGRVTDVLGRPVSGVRILAEPEENDDADDIETRTDGRGSFRLAGLVPGKYTLRIFDADHQTIGRLPSVAAGTARLAFQADWGHRIAGRLVDGAGRPRAGWAVGAYRRKGALPSSEARTNKQGRFVLDNLIGGEWTLKIGRYGHHEADSGGKVRAGATNVTLVMK